MDGEVNIAWFTLRDDHQGFFSESQHAMPSFEEKSLDSSFGGEKSQ